MFVFYAKGKSVNWAAIYRVNTLTCGDRVSDMLNRISPDREHELRSIWMIPGTWDPGQ